jgi:hypothetical protein
MIDNPDCVYSGDGYRYISLSNMDNIMTKLDLDNLIDSEVDNCVKSFVKQDNKYQSWSKSENDVIGFIDTLGPYNETENEWGQGIVIMANISGLDYKKLYRKYKKVIQKAKKDSVMDEIIGDENEIIAKIPSDYDVIAIYYQGQYYDVYVDENVENVG